MCNRHKQNDKSATLNLFIFAVKTLHLSLENIIDIYIYMALFFDYFIQMHTTICFLLFIISLFNKKYKMLPSFRDFW